MPVGMEGQRDLTKSLMTTNPHETWQDEPQREPRTIADALRAENESKSADQERKNEQQLDESRGLWGRAE